MTVVAESASLSLFFEPADSGSFSGIASVFVFAKVFGSSGGFLRSLGCEVLGVVPVALPNAV